MKAWDEIQAFRESLKAWRDTMISSGRMDMRRHALAKFRHDRELKLFTETALGLKGKLQ